MTGRFDQLVRNEQICFFVLYREALRYTRCSDCTGVMLSIGIGIAAECHLDTPRLLVVDRSIIVVEHLK
jgi:hypothetical protein